MNIERSPLGAIREREVRCIFCRARTWNHSAVCTSCLKKREEREAAYHGPDGPMLRLRDAAFEAGWNAAREAES